MSDDAPLRAGRLAVLAAAAAVLSACTTGAATAPPPPQAERPPPPKACALDVDAMAAATGLTWTADQTTATDGRCVYDPSAVSGAGASPDFMAVELAPATNADTAIDDVAGLCDPGTRTPSQAGDGGFVCRYQGGAVFAALLRGGELVTVSASEIPPGTTAARLALAMDEQLTRLGG